MAVIGTCLLSSGWANQEKEMYHTGLGLLIVGYTLILLRSSTSEVLFHPMNISFFLLISGCLILSNYFLQMSNSQRFSYHGPVYVTDLVAMSDTTLYQGQCGSLSCYDEGYKAQVHVTFGLKWACHTMKDNKTCDSIATYDECNASVCNGRNCTQQEHIIARQNVIHCLESILNTTQLQVNQSKIHSPFNPYHEYPYATLYANCNTCEVAVSIPNAMDILHPGSIIAYVGFSILIIICLIHRKMRQYGTPYDSLFSVSSDSSKVVTFADEYNI